MCGIVGYYLRNNGSIDEKILIKMRDTLVHRGPDDAGIYISHDHKMGLGHRRLSIIDLSPTGHQPMCNEDGTIWITYNGEIYNFKEVKNELIKQGHIFKSNTDTEVILHAYEQYGYECMKKFIGMFAFAIYDERKRIIFLVRDRFGIKPLYYFLGSELLIFASELKAICQYPDFKKIIDYGAVGEYFKYRYISSPKTIWKNIYKLSPGHYGIYDIEKNQFTIKCYYNLSQEIINKKSDLDEIEFLLSDSVKKRLIADVEVGSFLSGGIDSSTITAIAKENNSQIKAFSIGFKDLEDNELPYSKIVADLLKINHFTQTIENIDGNIIDHLSFYYDEPLADSSCIPTYLLSQLAVKHVKVALSGDGGDEVFCGYNWYGQILDRFNRLLFLKIKYFKFFPDKFEDFYNQLLLNRFDSSKLKLLFTSEIYKKFNNEARNIFYNFLKVKYNNIKLFQYIDLNTFLPDDILAKVDRASMANSLEVRVPMLDHRLVEAVLSISDTKLLNNFINKPILKKIMDQKLPAEIINRRKKGFSAPLTKWQYYKQIPSFINNGYLINDNIINKEFVNDLINNRYPNSQGMLWMIYIFEKWYQKWYLNE